jgi:N-sulfoglucosamine sulfohydrolase
MCRLFLFAVCLLVTSLAIADERPNVVWIIADDLGPELGCYGYPDVATPNLDRLAASGRRYNRAFSTAPVCSASRTAFQTGLYQTTVGGHHHDTHDKRVLPDSIPTVTGLMQKAGYFVCNGRGISPPEAKLAKSHLNFVYDARKFFDGVDWSQRGEGQPFFAQVQITEPHREFVKSDRPRPAAPIPPYYPEHPVTRADWANYLASIEALDQKVGAVLDRLESEGFARNTLVIFFGDHGRPHVRGKQWLYDGGLHTPLIVRWPGKIKAGEVTDGLASLLDLMPTTLAAAGAKVPELHGMNLLDANWTGHAQVFGARDRCGDAIDRIRSLRTRDFKYIRNFHPETPYMQHSGYKKLSYPVETLMKVLHAEGRWDSPFMAKARPMEELYDLMNDPYEMTNLAADPEQAERLTEMREAVNQWIKETGDQGGIDESLTVDLDSLKKKKWKWYENSMKRRGLDPNVTDQDYLKWWEKELAVK